MQEVTDLSVVLENQEMIIALVGDFLKVVIIGIGLLVGLFCLNFFFRTVFDG